MMATVITNLLAGKLRLIEQLGVAQDAEEREKIEKEIEQINTALDFLDKPKPHG